MDIIIRKKYIKILGLFIDEALIFTQHLQQIKKKLNFRIYQLMCLSNKNYGSNQYSLKLLYLSYIRPIIEYASIIYYPCMSNSNKKKIEILQNNALRIITGLSSGADKSSLLLEADLELMEDRINKKILFYCEKFYRYNNNFDINIIINKNIYKKRINKICWFQYKEDIYNEIKLNNNININIII